MIIDCGIRRLVSSSNNWTIQIKKVREKGNEVGTEYWDMDRPAHPASLTRALELILEREVMDAGDTTLAGLQASLKDASHAVHNYMKKAREAA